VLDAAVRELQEQGTTVVAVRPGTLSARIVRFRWGDSVLEINRHPGTSPQVTGGTRTRLGRQDPERQAETLKHYLASAVADLVAGTW
jgi:NAD(P)-dependent dehydrogenase (short-subunit alcohol dehydrogenase family)